jgi:hypothetical protein
MSVDRRLVIASTVRSTRCRTGSRTVERKPAGALREKDMTKLRAVFASVVVVISAALFALSGDAEAGLPASGCAATPTRDVAGTVIVHVGGLVGYLDGSHDVVGGRLALHVGRWRVRGEETQKIPWFVTATTHAQPPVLTVTGVRSSPSAARFTQSFGAAAGVYPSIIAPPSAGCWRLTLAAGDLGGTVTALVRR